jgi:hypothetical protein
MFTTLLQKGAAALRAAFQVENDESMTARCRRLLGTGKERSCSEWAKSLETALKTIDPNPADDVGPPVDRSDYYENGIPGRGPTEKKSRFWDVGEKFSTRGSDLS